VVVLFVLDIINFVKYVSDDIPEVSCIPMYLEWFHLLLTLTKCYHITCEISCNVWDQTWTIPVCYEHNKCDNCFGLVLYPGLLINTSWGQSVSFSCGIVSLISGSVGLVRNRCSLLAWTWAGQILQFANLSPTDFACDTGPQHCGSFGDYKSY
jgi:hypothetical protein